MRKSGARAFVVGALVMLLGIGALTSLDSTDRTGNERPSGEVAGLAPSAAPTLEIGAPVSNPSQAADARGKPGKTDVPSNGNEQTTRDVPPKQTSVSSAVSEEPSLREMLTGLIFSSTVTGNAEIFMLDADGRAVNVTDSPQYGETNPEYSGDGTRITFVGDRAGQHDIWTMDADGTDPYNASNYFVYEADPTWGARINRIAFVRNMPGETYDIWAMNPDGSAQVNLTPSESAEQFPAFSPDGQTIAFQTDRDGNMEIYTMTSRGDNLTRLTDEPVSDDFPTWSPDGTKIAFESSRDGDMEIFTMNADGTGLKQLTHNKVPDYTPSWSPDGRWIVYGSIKGPTQDLYVVPAAGGKEILVLGLKGEESTPSWRPAI